MSSVSGCGGNSAAYQGLQTMRSTVAQKTGQLFAKLDVNGDKSIDASELMSLTDFIGAKTGTKVDAAALLKAVDSNGDGSVSSTELTDNVQSLFDNLRGQLSGVQKNTTPDIDKLFAALDSDGDGSISASEFKAGMQQHGPKGPSGGSPPDQGGRLIASLLEQYGAQSASSTSSTSLSAAA